LFQALRSGLNNNITKIQNLNQNFKSYLEQQANKIHNVRLEIDIKTPYEEKGLQVADCISWAIFRKYEFKDRTYYDLIRGTIAEENMLFHAKKK